ncbi:MAG: hypothetical protein Q8936_11730 [Bacillota bacterium]|nr:hypothetical protein [Bacillota bacterium]
MNLEEARKVSVKISKEKEEEIFKNLFEGTKDKKDKQDKSDTHKNA